MIIRTAICAGCKTEQKEETANAGWKDWIIIQGVKLNDDTNPLFCPDCTGKIMTFIDRGMK